MIGEFEDATLVGNERIEEVIHLFHQEQKPELLMAVCLAIRERMMQVGYLIFPADIEEDAEGMLDAALTATRIDMTAAAKRQFFEKHIKPMRLVIDEAGNASLELRRK